MVNIRGGHSQTQRRGAGETDGPHGEDRWRDCGSSALHHHLPRCRAPHEETVRTFTRAHVYRSACHVGDCSEMSGVIRSRWRVLFCTERVDEVVQSLTAAINNRYFS